MSGWGLYTLGVESLTMDIYLDFHCQRVRSNLTQRRKKLRIHDAVFYGVKQNEYFCVKCYEMLPPNEAVPQVRLEAQHLRPRISYALNCSSQRLARTNTFRCNQYSAKTEASKTVYKCGQISVTLDSIKRIQQSVNVAFGKNKGYLLRLKVISF